MALRWYSVVVVPAWADELTLRLPFEQVPPRLAFVRVEHDKTTKNRLHFDLAQEAGDDRDAHIDRLLAMGARRVDVGQGPDVTWVVLADPDGNEFCVL